MKKNSPLVLSLCLVAMAPLGAHAQTSGLYPINYDEAQPITNTNRYTNAITLVSGDGQQSVDVNQLTERRLYIKRLDDCLFAKPGETVTAGFSSVLSWMAGYAYIDLDNNGLFDVEYDANGVVDMNELMTYSLYKDKDSKGNAVVGCPNLNPPSFVIPADTQPGIYRMRYKVDWDNVDPGGNNGTTNKITTNGGVIVDTRINIHGMTANVTIADGTVGGTVALADGAQGAAAEVEFGKDLKLKLNPDEGYSLSYFIVKHGYNLDGEQFVNDNRQWEESMVNVSADDDNVCTLGGRYLDGNVIVKPVFAKVSASDGEKDYGLAFGKDLKHQDSSTKLLNTITLTPASGASQTINVSGNAASSVYNDLTNQAASVKAGDTITPSVECTGADGMTASLFVDLNQNGRFATEIGEDGAVTPNSELVSYSYYNGTNSNGEAVSEPTLAMPAFKLPESLPEGCYRARLLFTASGIAPEGSADMAANGGYVVDFLLNVHGDESQLEVNGVGGNVVGADNTGIPATTTYGTALRLLPVAPADGYKVDRIVVRHGHGLKGEQYINGNRQWDEYETTEASVGSTFTVPADCVDGDVAVTAYFSADGTEEYKLKFADEFDGEDGSLPNSTFWSNCTRENPTWKRFTSQTKEGQARTAFLRDGKLVTRCIANDIPEEGNVDMISGAIESSGKVYYNYGIIEGRLRTTPHTGNFPAFWLMPEDNSAGWPNAGEIDLWEQIDNENKTYHTVHTHVTYDLHQALPNSGSVSTNSADYHIISMNWEPTLLTWYVDGKKAFSYAKSSSQTLLNQGQWPYDKPFYIILNQSVGNGSWAQPCDVNFEYETLFDYVRLYQKEGQTAVVPSGTGIDGTAAPAAARLDFYAQKNGVRLVAPEAQVVRIVDVAGRVVFSQMVQGNVDVALPKGVYAIAGKKLLVP